MRAQPEKEHLQGVRRGEHLPAQSDKEPVQDVQSRQGRVIAAGSRGALTCSTHAGVFVRPQGVSGQSLTQAPSLPTAQILCFCNYRHYACFSDSRWRYVGHKEQIWIAGGLLLLMFAAPTPGPLSIAMPPLRPPSTPSTGEKNSNSRRIRDEFPQATKKAGMFATVEPRTHVV